MNQKIAKNTLVLYFRMLFSMLVSLYTSRVVLRELGVSDFGVYNVVGGIVILFAFINSAMSSSTQRYLVFEIGTGNKDKLKKVFNSSLLIHLLISVVVIILAETVGLFFLCKYMIIPPGRMYAASWIYQFSIISCVISVINVPFNAIIISYEKMSIFAFFSISEVMARLFVVFMLQYSPIDKLIFYSVLLLIISCISNFFYFIYCRKNFAETGFAFSIDKPLIREMMIFASWNLWGNLASVVSNQGVNMLLNIFFGPVVNAARGIAVQVQQAVLAFITNFQLAFNPQITKSYAGGDLEKMHKLVISSSKISFFLLFFLSMPVLIETDFLLKLWLGKIPEYTVIFLRIILITSLIEVIANPLMISAQATGKIKMYQMVIGGILLLTVPLSYAVLKLKTIPEIVFIIYFIIALVAQLFRIMLVCNLINLPYVKYFSAVIVRILIVICCSVFFPVMLDLMLPDTISSFFVICLTSGIVTVIFVYCFGLNKSEKQFAIKYLRTGKIIKKRDSRLL